MSTNKTEIFMNKLNLIYEETLNELKDKYKLNNDINYKVIFNLMKEAILIDFIDTLFVKENFNITTDDIKEHLDLDPRYITSKFNNYIDYTRFPEGAYLYFEQGALSLVEKEKLKRKIVFYNQDSYKTFLKENIYLINESKKINIDISKLKIDDNLKKDIDIDKLIISEIKAIKKEYYKNSNIKKNISNIDDETIDKILNKEINFLTTSTLKNFVKNDIISRQKYKLLSILEIEKNSKNIDSKTYDNELKEINKTYTLNNTDIYNYKNIYNEAYDAQLERFLHTKVYKEYNLYLESNSTPIRLFHFEKDLLSFTYEDTNNDEDINKNNILKYSIDKAVWYETIETDIINKIQSKIDKQIVNRKKEIATNKRAKEELQLKKALKDKELKQKILNTTKNNKYHTYILNVIEKLSQED